MKLKATLKTLDGLPEAFAALYTKVGEEFVLDVDDTPFKAKLGEFRENNVALSKAKEKLESDLAKYDGIDPERAQEALEAIHKMEASEEGKLIRDGKIDEVVARRTKKIASDHEAAVAAIQRKHQQTAEKNAALAQRIQRMIRHERVQEAVTRVGNLRPGALRDVLNRADGIFRVEGEDFESIKAVDERGNALTNKKGEPLTIDEWAQGLLTDADYLFERAQGGGARSQTPGRGTGGTAPGVIVVDRNDPFAKGRNAADIVSGKAVVR